MTGGDRPYVFDSGPLSHFAQAGWLGLLREVAGDEEAWIPSTVRREIADGVDKYPHLRGVLDADWLRRREVSSLDEMNAFGKYTSRMLGEDQRKNLGECEVLALAEVHNGIAVLDDAVARNAAQDYGVEVRTTVALLCDLIRAKHISLDLASTIADRLLQTEYRLPFDEGGFRMFVIEHDYLPYE